MYIQLVIHRKLYIQIMVVILQIRYRNIIRNSDNIIQSGSATLVENSYVPNANGNRLQNHSRQRVIERLGKVLWINDNDKNQGIFNSPSRGLVFYDLKKDQFIPVDAGDSRLNGTSFQVMPDRIHTNFGNAFLFFSEMEKTPFMNVLRESITKKVLYQKILAHLFHDCMKNGSSIKCGEFLKGSILSYILADIPFSNLDCDTSYFKSLSDDNLKTSFFKTLVMEMRKTIPEFGRACYADSTPLPGEAENNPFNALSSHGTDGAVIQARLILILDIQTNIPVWFEIIPANVLDKSTIISITKDVKATLDVDIEIYDLDAGYARKELFELFNRDNNTYHDNDGIMREHTVLVRMPATNGYPRDDLYIRCKPNFYNGRYSFDYEHHTFFGERVQIDLFEYPEYAFVFIDKTQAESLLRGWREQHLAEWEALSGSAQDWYQVKDGFFILIGNKDQSPKSALVEYRGRASIEGFFRDGKTYLKILPLAKWNKQTVTGKVLHDIMETIFYRAYRRRVASVNMSMSGLIVCMDSWECFKSTNELLEVKTPKAQVREAVEKLGYAVPGHIDLLSFKRQILEGIPMDLEPVTMRTKRKTNKTAPPISPEEKLAAKEQANREQIITEAQNKLTKAEARADRNFEKAKSAAEQKRTKAIDRAKKKMEKSQASAKRDLTRQKAEAIYEVSITGAENEYQRTITEARTTCDKAKEEAKAAYRRDVANV